MTTLELIDSNYIDSMMVVIESLQDFVAFLLKKDNISHNDFFSKTQECIDAIDRSYAFMNEENRIRLRNVDEKLKQYFDEYFEHHANDLMNLQENDEPIKLRKLENHQQLFVQEPKFKNFDTISGHAEIKKTLTVSFLLRKTQPQLYKMRKLDTPNTILFFGPPGTGKTMFAHVLAAELNATFFSVSSSDLITPLVGETEKNIKKLFEFSKSDEGLSVIFIDEIDGFCRKRTTTEQDFTRRLKTEIMCQLSNIESYNNVIVIGATNCPWEIDTAILRRFTNRIFVSLPNPIERIEFLNKLIQIDLTANSNEFHEIIESTEGFSNSDLETIVQHASNLPIIELLDTKFWKKTNDNHYEPANVDNDDIIYSSLSELPYNSVRARFIQISDLINEAKKYKATVSKSDMENYLKFTN